MPERDPFFEQHNIDISFLNDTDYVRRALALSKQAHDGEIRKIRGEPFLTHPLGVVAISSAYNRSDESQALGLMHDFSDSPFARERISLSEVREIFGLEMVLRIGSLSKSRKITDPEGQRKDYLEITKNEDDALVQETRAADKIHNLRMAGEELLFVDHSSLFWSKFKGGREAYLQWPRDVLAALVGSKALDHHLILDEYADELETFYRTVAQVEKDENPPLGRPA